MRHRRGIDLLKGTNPESANPGEGDRQVRVGSRGYLVTFAELPSWIAMGAECSACRRTGLLDRWQLSTTFGKHTVIMSLEWRLRCTGCGNRRRNLFQAAKAPR